MEKINKIAPYPYKRILLINKKEFSVDICKLFAGLRTDRPGTDGGVGSVASWCAHDNMGTQMQCGGRAPAGSGMPAGFPILICSQFSYEVKEK